MSDKLSVAFGLVGGCAFVVLFAIFSADHPQLSALQVDGADHPVEIVIDADINLERKARLGFIESGLREQVSHMGFETYAVNLNPQTAIIEVVTDDPTKNDQVRAMFARYESEAQLNFSIVI